jgi:mannose-6-phosphate isomerase
MPFTSLKLTNSKKETVFTDVENYLTESGLKIVAKDPGRPWGGFFVIDEMQAGRFGQLFFPELKIEDLEISGKLSPKILLVQPRKRLSWQYHHRRAEIWRIIAGKVGVVTSPTDEESDIIELKQVGDTVRLTQGQRHRLVGLSDWGVVAEIWQHTDRAHPSDEEDIIRLQDDFGR